MAPVLGIDLGTTNSVVCVADGGELRVLPDEDGNLLIPSVVSFHPAGDVIVGHTARERRLLDAKNTVYSIKRLIGRPFHSPEVARARERFPFELCMGPTEGVLVRARGETYTLPEISAFVLREVRRIAEARLGEATSRAVITVPANFNELQRSATKAAGRVAGLDVLRILNEPTAAALAYGYGKGSRERIAVFDLGGGTFDITILELAGDVFEVLSTAGDTFLGGDDIDVLIAEKMADAFLAHHRFDPRADAQAFERLRAAAEWAKCQLSSETDVQLRVEELAFGEAGASLDLTFGMTRSALEGLARPLIARAFDVCEDAMSVAGIRPTQLDNVILVGGSTRIPLVRQMVREYFGREPLGSIDPDLVVARGAALQASALSPALDGSGPKPLARVALRRVSLADMAPVEARRADLDVEVARQRPRGPAFQPGRGAELEPDPGAGAWEDSPTVGAGALGIVPEWESLDEQPTRVKEGELETRVAKGEDLWADMTGRANRPEPSTTAGGQDYERAARASSIPPGNPEAYASVPSKPALPPPPPPQSARRAPVKPVGGSTLGFGSVGLPVPDFGPDPPAAAPPPPPPAPPPPAARAPEPPRAASAAPSSGAPSSAAPSSAAPSWSASSRPAPMPSPVRPPLLLDVTPHTLGVETVGGYCEGVIARNAAIPVEQTRLFSTAKDGQQLVSFRIYQGESRRLDENQPLGHIELTGLRQAARGQVTIEVTFVMDADGTLGVRARDPETGREQTVRINLVGGVGDDEIQRMTERQAQRLGVH